MRARGFTLIEVLVALAIVATTLAALGRAMLSGLEAERELKARSCAQWIADDRLALHAATYSWIPPGQKSGDAEQAGMAFIWREDITATPNIAFGRIEITVALRDRPERILGRRTGFLYRTAG